MGNPLAWRQEISLDDVMAATAERERARPAPPRIGRLTLMAMEATAAQEFNARPERERWQAIGAVWLPILLDL